MPDKKKKPAELDAGREGPDAMPALRYQPPRPLREDPPLVGRVDMPVLLAISRVVEEREGLLESRRKLALRIDALEEEISVMEERRPWTVTRK